MINCKSCSKSISENSAFCKYCGKKVLKSQEGTNRSIPYALKWEEFENKKNTNDILKKKAKRLAPVINNVSEAAYNSLDKKFNISKFFQVKFKMIDDEPKFVLYPAFLFLFYNIADRHAFSFLGDQKRNIFLNTLKEELFKEVCKLKGDKQNDMFSKDWFFKTADKFQRLLGGADSILLEENNMTDTIMWLFSDYICQVIKVEKQLEMSFDTTCIVGPVMRYLNLKKLFVGK